MKESNKKECCDKCGRYLGHLNLKMSCACGKLMCSQCLPNIDEDELLRVLTEESTPTPKQDTKERVQKKIDNVTLPENHIAEMGELEEASQVEKLVNVYKQDTKEWEKEFDNKFKEWLDTYSVYEASASKIKSFIRSLLQTQREKIIKILKPCLDYCKEQNGLDHCKNCGLSEDVIKKIQGL